MAAVDSFMLLYRQIAGDLDTYRSNATSILAIVGAYYTLKFTFSFASSIIKTLILSLKRKNLVKCYGRWAVITGSTSGIGEAFAHELADKRLNLVLISRSQEKLDQQAKYLENYYSIHVITIAHDFANEHSVEEIKSVLKDLEIGILINNVGIHYLYPMQFDEVSECIVRDMVQTNIASMVNMTHSVIPGMLKRRRGLIVNMSSAAGFFPMPLISLYSSTKTFANQFSQSLHHELRSYNIHVQALEPNYIQTKMVEFSVSLSNSIMTPSAKTFAHSAVKTFGQYKVNAGYFPHTILNWFLTLPPMSVCITGSHIMHKYLHKEGINSTKKSE